MEKSDQPDSEVPPSPSTSRASRQLVEQRREGGEMKEQKYTPFAKMKFVRPPALRASQSALLAQATASKGNEEGEKREGALRVSQSSARGAQATSSKAVGNEDREKREGGGFIQCEVFSLGLDEDGRYSEEKEVQGVPWSIHSKKEIIDGQAMLAFSLCCLYDGDLPWNADVEANYVIHHEDADLSLKGTHTFLQDVEHTDYFVFSWEDLGDEKGFLKGVSIMIEVRFSFIFEKLIKLSTPGRVQPHEVAPSVAASGNQPEIKDQPVIAPPAKEKLSVPVNNQMPSASSPALPPLPSVVMSQLITMDQRVFDAFVAHPAASGGEERLGALQSWCANGDLKASRRLRGQEGKADEGGERSLRSLSIFPHRDVIVDALRKVDVTVVLAPEGAGRETMGPLLLTDLLRSIDGKAGNGSKKGLTLCPTSDQAANCVQQCERMNMTSRDDYCEIINYCDPFEGIACSVEEKARAKYTDSSLPPTPPEHAITTYRGALIGLDSDAHLKIIQIDEVDSTKPELLMLLALTRDLLQKGKAEKILLTAVTLDQGEVRGLESYFDEKGLTLTVVDLSQQLCPTRRITMSCASLSAPDLAGFQPTNLSTALTEEFATMTFLFPQAWYRAKQLGWSYQLIWTPPVELTNQFRKSFMIRGLWREERFTEEANLLHSYFPNLAPEHARFVIMGVRLGLAAHAICYVAETVTSHKLCGHPTKIAENFEGISDADVYETFVAVNHLLSWRGERVRPYDAGDSVARADLLVTWLRHSFPTAHAECEPQFDKNETYSDDEWKELEQRAEKNPDGLFWSGTWCKGKFGKMGDESIGMKRLQEGIIREEGRVLLCAAIDEITKTCERLGIVSTLSQKEGKPSLLSPRFNRYLRAEDNYNLNEDGRALFRALLTMNSDKLARSVDRGRFKIAVDTNDAHDGCILPVRGDWLQRDQKCAVKFGRYWAALKDIIKDEFIGSIDPLSTAQCAFFLNLYGMVSPEGEDVKISLNGSPEGQKEGIFIGLDYEVSRRVWAVRESLLRSTRRILQERGGEFDDVAMAVIYLWKELDDGMEKSLEVQPKWTTRIPRLTLNH